MCPTPAETTGKPSRENLSITPLNLFMLMYFLLMANLGQNQSFIV